MCLSSKYITAYLSIYPTIYLYTYLSIYLFICLSIYLSAYRYSDEISGVRMRGAREGTRDEEGWEGMRRVGVGGGLDKL